MKQFTQEQVKDLRARAGADHAILALLQKSLDALQGQYLVQETGLATWSGYYACPEHSVRLEFDILKPNEHRCPVDGYIYTGEPYDGAWWRIVNDKNAQACYHAALLYLLTSKMEYLDFAKQMLLRYAENYANYKLHGDIPYNKPGRVNAQVLCDAQWTRTMVFAFDIICGDISAKEERDIVQLLLRPSAEFLMLHRTGQLHNHEVIVSSTVGILGIVLEEDSYLHFALDTKYGLRYQLKHGFLGDGFWFEGSVSYHCYCLAQYIAFECFARGTVYSFFRDAFLLDLLKFPLRLRMADQSLPLLNDAGVSNVDFSAIAYVYELAYAETGDKGLAAILHLAYKNKPRCNIEAFFLGAKTLPKVEMPSIENYHARGTSSSGLTILHGPKARSLLVKHGPFGGEHDHYDRLALHYVGLGKDACPDIGTTDYGAPLHYAYFKNSLTHNTVCLDGKNQPPANCETVLFEQGPEYTLLDTAVRWDGTYKALDSFTIKQWSDGVYEGVAMRRVIAWYGTYLVDAFLVKAPEPRNIDWMLHVRGERQNEPDAEALPGPWYPCGPGKYLHTISRLAAKPGWRQTTWNLGDGCEMQAFSRLQQDINCHFAKGPDNPPVRDLSYMMQQKKGTEALFLNVLCIQKADEPIVECVYDVRDAHDIDMAIIRSDGKIDRFQYSFSQ